ncbi:CPBP family intramembrane glutamic endopeptidase [Patulibacter defluvii]|uniref:CPBP family intramembrane glutamic endopeptidase n=1 Tax=Patulibacter defluvii TaxID=3095358 RepID=UPI002A7489A3|nr:type II CAAX endopeptidase family protein [Patulibacter sp. DM4]
MEGFLALVVTLGVTLFASVPAAAIGDGSDTAEVAGKVLSLVIQNVIFVGAPVAFLTIVGVRVRRSSLGLRVPARIWTALAIVVAAFVVYLLLSNGLAELLGVGDKQDDLPKDLGVDISPLAAILIGLCTTVLAPIGEEVLMRGVVFPGLRDGLARWMPMGVAIGTAALIDGILFGGLHAGGTDAGFLPILAAFGAVLCLLYQATGSLYAPILLHATNNAIAISAAKEWSFGQGAALWAGAMVLLVAIALAARAIEGRVVGGDSTAPA